MRTRRVLPWVVGALAVLAIAVGGVFANLAVLESGEADAAIGSLSAKSIQSGEAWNAPAAPAPTLQVETAVGTHHDRAGHRDDDD